MVLGRTKTIFKCCETFKNQFKNAHCSLTISVNQPDHEGDRIYSTLQSINAYFQSCNIMVCDTLQRHTMAIYSNKTQEILYKNALEAGDQWIQRNKSIIEILEIKHTITRWNFWLQHSNFFEKKKEMLAHYQKDPKFKSAMEKTIQQFKNRILRRDSTLAHDAEKIFENSFEYLIEECAVQSLWIDSSYEFEIYPSERNPILAYCYEMFIRPQFYFLLKPVALKFKQRTWLVS